MPESLERKERQSETDHPLKGYWLVRQVRTEHTDNAFKTLMNLPRKEALERLRASEKKFNGDYLKERALIEAVLLDGGFTSNDSFQPESAYPIYFRLLPEPQYSKEDGRTLINIPIHHVPAAHMTFTIEDSFLNFGVESQQIYSHGDSLAWYADRDGSYNPDPQVYSPEILRDYFSEKGFPEELVGQDSARYIECQVWSLDLPIFEEAQARLNHAPDEEVIVLE